MAGVKRGSGEGRKVAESHLLLVGRGSCFLHAGAERHGHVWPRFYAGFELLTLFSGPVGNGIRDPA